MRSKLCTFFALLAIVLLSASAFADSGLKGPVAKYVTKHGVVTTTEQVKPSTLPQVGTRNPNSLDEVIISEDFEAYGNGEVPPGWIVVDVDGGTNPDPPGPFGGPSVWQTWGGTGWTAHSGVRFICNAFNSGAVPNDDWLIIPAGTLGAPISFSYWRSSQDPLYLDSYELRVSTSGTDPADFSDLIIDENDVPAEWGEQTHDLSDYADAPFYIAFHYDATDEFVFKVDDVLLEGVPGEVVTGSLDGTVTDADSNDPVSGVLVSVLGTASSGTTGGDGTYTIDDIDVGTYTVRFTKTGYTPTDVDDVVITENETTTVDAQIAEIQTANADDCDNPMVVTDGEYEFSTENATVDGSVAELPEECDEGFGLVFAADIWFAYTAPGAGNVTFSTCNTADYDTRTACYTAGTEDCPPCPTTNVDFYACNDDGVGCAGYSSLLEFEVEADVCYLLRLGGFGTETGTGTVSIEFTAAPEPVIDVDPTSLDFGDVAVGDSAELDLDITNNGSATLIISDISSPEHFSTSLSALGVPAGATRTITVTFAPTADGTFSGDLEITSNAPTSPTLVAVSGGTLDAGDHLPVAEEYYVARNYPNPFNPETTISFAIPRAEHVRLVVYNSLGQEIAVLNDRRLDAGRHDFLFSGADLPSGLYFARISAEGFNQTLKTVLLK